MLFLLDYHWCEKMGEVFEWTNPLTVKSVSCEMTSNEPEQLNVVPLLLLKGFVNRVLRQQDWNDLIWLMSSLISILQRGTLKVSRSCNNNNNNNQDILHTPRAVTSKFIWDSNVRKQNLEVKSKSWKTGLVSLGSSRCERVRRSTRQRQWVNDQKYYKKQSVCECWG